MELRKLWVFIFGLLLDGTLSSEIQTQTLPSGCNDLEDGLHYLQPMSQEDLADYDAVASPIKVYCSNGYAVIDPNLDSGVLNYLSSYHKYTSSYAGPSLDDHVTWSEWWLPATLDSEMTWSISPDCITCTDTDTLEYGSTTTYYMTADSYGCNWPTKNLCDYDPFTLVCSSCSALEGTSNGAGSQSGKCGHVESAANTVVYTTHAGCTEESRSTIPSIGTTSKYCVCFKPSTVEQIECDTSLIDTTIQETENTNELDEILYDDIQRVVYLYQDDFKYGTYRITVPGTYIIAEDIEFDFNAGDLNNPNAADAWFPHTSQQDEYPGANDYDGWYWLGFFAGITIETANVVIDLNNHEIKMSPAFYFQQRWFICIELNNKAFLDGQGPAWTGTDIVFSSDITIKNGIIGLSSHMGIHGNNVTNVVIQNVQVRDFETHGITFNQFSNLLIENVEIGPGVRGQIGLNGNYALARINLFSLRGAAQDAGNKTIRFHGTNKDVTLQTLVDRLVAQMDLAFKWAYYGIEGEGKEWEEAYSQFAHDGVIFPGTMYGLVLRPRGASVFNYDFCNGYPGVDATIRNVTIHDFVTSTIEYVATATTSKTWARDPINAPITYEFVTHNNLNPWNESIYLGNAWTDVMMGARKLTDSWWYLARLSMSDDLVTWAESGLPLGVAAPISACMCNFDCLGHVSKGIIGVKLEGVQNVVFEDLTIENLMNVGELGSTKCGEYSDGTDGGMPLQTATYNKGYGGTLVHGIAIFNSSDIEFTNVKVSKLFSAQAFVYGMYVSNSVTNLKLNNVAFEHLSAGVLNEEDYSVDHLPNVAAASCAIETESSTSVMSESSVSAKCLYGHTYCATDYCGTNNLGTCVGEVNECDVSATYYLPSKTVQISKEFEITTVDNTNFGFDPVIDSSLFSKKTVVSNHSSTIGTSFYYYACGFLTIVLLMGVCSYYLKKHGKSPISYFNDPYSGYVTISNESA